MARIQFLSSRSQAGQAIVLIALMMVVLFGAIGLAVDGGLGYYYNNEAERAASAAALAGVIFMPNQFTHAQAIPAATRNDASDRAQDEARRNGFDWNDVADGVTVTAAVVPGYSNRLSVTVTRTVHTFFMQLFGVSSFTISRTAVASYLQPLSLGQPGIQVGSPTSQLGTANNYFFMRMAGYSSDRQDGDPFTTNPNNPPASYGTSTDVHAISRSQGTDPVGASLPDRGGYNYEITLPNGGYIQVYNATFGPDNTPALVGAGGPASESWANGAPGGATHNNCDNHVSTATKKLDQCSAGGSYYLHEEDQIDFSSYGATQQNDYTANEYTVESVANQFIRASDTIVSQVIVKPIDASGFWRTDTGCPAACTNLKAYNPINSIGSYINQTYDSTGNPTNMLTYHAWVDITGANYTGASDGGTFQRIVTPAPGPLPAGTYRLRIDTLGFDGTLPPPNGVSVGGVNRHAYAVRVVDAAGLAGGTFSCTGCALAAWDDMCLYTPFAIAAGGHFDIPMFQVPPDYAGQTITLDVFDTGDVTVGAGNVDLLIVDNTGAVFTVTAPTVVNVWNLGVSQGNTGPAVACTGSGGATIPPTPCLIQTGTPQTAIVRATNAGTAYYNSYWVRFELPIPSSYAPGVNPNNWWWSFRYQISVGTTAMDTMTFAIALKGNPAHLVSS